MTELKVKLADDRQFEAEVVATDPMTDVAVIRIKGGVPPDLPTVRLGDSDTLHAGGLVLAIGAPFGLTQTVTHGIISATGRSNVGIADFEDFLQTDTPINPGNSGGPLVNMHGEVIGMNSAIATRVGQSAGVGFAIPINMIKSMLPTLVAGQPITRGMLGVIVQEVDQDLARQFQLPDTKGAIVAQVNPSTAAERAGVEVGDVIVSFDGKPVMNTRDLRNRVAATAVGSKVEVELIRGGEERTLEVRIGERPSAALEAGSPRGPDGAPDRAAELGITAQTLTPDLHPPRRAGC
jgi:serine protease Do